MPEFDEKFLVRAVELAREGSTAGYGGPFGAVVVKNGQIIAEAYNRVLRDVDPTAHAEVSAIRLACAALHSFQLEDCEIYLVRALPDVPGRRLLGPAQVLYFAADREDAARADFDDSLIYDELTLPHAGRTIPFLVKKIPEAAQVFIDWKNNADRVPTDMQVKPAMQVSQRCR